MICGLISRRDAVRTTIGRMKLHGSFKAGRDLLGSSMDSLYGTIRYAKTDPTLRSTKLLRSCTSSAREKH